MNNTLEPVISPLCLTLKLEEDINNSSVLDDADIDQFGEYANSVLPKVAPAILP